MKQRVSLSLYHTARTLTFDFFDSSLRVSFKFQNLISNVSSGVTCRARDSHFVKIDHECMQLSCSITSTSRYLAAWIIAIRRVQSSYHSPIIQLVWLKYRARLACHWMQILTPGPLMDTCNVRQYLASRQPPMRPRLRLHYL